MENIIKPPKLLIGTFVNWNNEQGVHKLQKQLSKKMKKFLKIKKVSNNRINTFNVAEATFNGTLEMNVDCRLSLEQEIHKILRNYAKSLQKRPFSKNQVNDIDQRLADILTDKGYKSKNFIEEIYTKINKPIKEKIDALIFNANVIIWSLENGEPDKIIINDFIADVEKNKINSLDESIDELLVTNLAKDFLPFTNELIDNLINFYNALKANLCSSNEIDNERYIIPIAIQRIVPSMIGTISGIQESLKLLERQVWRLDELALETVEELQKYSSKQLTEWLAIDYQRIRAETIEKIDQLNLLLFQIKQGLRSSSSSDKIVTDQLFVQIIQTNSLVSGLRRWIHQFEDLPSFTTATNGIAYEEVENEDYFPTNNSFIETTKVFKNFYRGDSTIYALRGVDLQIDRGEFVIIRGPSGAGKTTLLNLLAGLDDANRGAIFFENENILEMKDRHRTKIRKNNFSFIFQSYALIPHLTAFENTKLPIEISGLSKELVEKIQQLLNDVGIGEFANHKPALLSGGQMQRLGIARALISHPKVIFADEPTGDLDVKTSKQIMDLIKQYHEETGTTIILVTHDDEVASYATRNIFLKDGKIVENAISV